MSYYDPYYSTPRSRRPSLSYSATPPILQVSLPLPSDSFRSLFPRPILSRPILSQPILSQPTRCMPRAPRFTHVHVRFLVLSRRILNATIQRTMTWTSTTHTTQIITPTHPWSNLWRSPDPVAHHPCRIPLLPTWASIPFAGGLDASSSLSAKADSAQVSRLVKRRQTFASQVRTRIHCRTLA